MGEAPQVVAQHLLIRQAFVEHLEPKHGFTRVLLVSGDREAEVKRLATSVKIDRIHAEQSPEQKVDIVGRENETAKTVFVGDGINDAPALLTATVGIAFGRNSDVTSEAARVVIIDSSLSKVDTLMHVSNRLRRVAVSLLKRTKTKGSIKTRRMKAGWDDDYLLQVLQGITAE